MVSDLTASPRPGELTSNGKQNQEKRRQGQDTQRYLFSHAATISAPHWYAAEGTRLKHIRASAMDKFFGKHRSFMRFYFLRVGYVTLELVLFPLFPIVPVTRISTCFYRCNPY